MTCMKKEVQILKEMINEVNSIVVFTGAGISTASGIPDFRSSNGLYNEKTNSSFSPEEIISHKFFYLHPEEFYDFYRNKMIYPNAKPNKAHKYFAKLEKQGKNITIVTQNIDGLHQEAGSKRVYELHGSIKRNYCQDCYKFYDEKYILNSKTNVPHCKKCQGIIKPDVVLYDEPLDEDIINRTILALMSTEMLIVIGTSLNVYPAAGFIRYFRGKYIVIINKDKTNFDNNMDLVIHDDVIKVIEELEQYE